MWPEAVVSIGMVSHPVWFAFVVIELAKFCQPGRECEDGIVKLLYGLSAT